MNENPLLCHAFKKPLIHTSQDHKNKQLKYLTQSSLQTITELNQSHK